LGTKKAPEQKPRGAGWKQTSACPSPPELRSILIILLLAHCHIHFLHSVWEYRSFLLGCKQKNKKSSERSKKSIMEAYGGYKEGGSYVRQRYCCSR
jgi:hypothetical protein